MLIYGVLIAKHVVVDGFWVLRLMCVVSFIFHRFGKVHEVKQLTISSTFQTLQPRAFCAAVVLFTNNDVNNGILSDISLQNRSNILWHLNSSLGIFPPIFIRYYSA